MTFSFSRAAVTEVARAALAALIAMAESADEVVEHNGTRYHFRQVTSKAWLTPFE